MRLSLQQDKAALIVQRYCRGHFVAKRFLKARGDISMAASLKTFRDMKHEIGTMLSNQIRFYWKVYLRKKENKKKKKKKGTKKGKKSTLSTKGSTISMGGSSKSITASPLRRNTTSVVSKNDSFKVSVNTKSKDQSSPDKSPSGKKDLSATMNPKSPN